MKLGQSFLAAVGALLFLQVGRAQIIYSEGFSNCDIDIGDREMICDVGFLVLWTLRTTASNSHRINNGAFVLANKGDGNPKSAETVIDVFDFTNLELNVQIVSPAGSQGLGDETKCRVIIDDVVRVGERQGVTDVFKFTGIQPLAPTITFRLENDKDKSKGPCEFDDFVLTGQTQAPTNSPTPNVDLQEQPSNITREANAGTDVIPILAPAFAVLGVLGIVIVLLMRRRRQMHENCEDMEMHDSSGHGMGEAIVPTKPTDIRYKRGGVRIKRKLNADYIEPRAKSKDMVREDSAQGVEGRSESPRSRGGSSLQRAKSSEETEDSETTSYSSPLGPSLEYLKRIQTEAHKSIFRPSSAFLQRAAKKTRENPPRTEQFSSRRSVPRESIDHDIDV